MPIVLSQTRTEVFIDKARSVHGDRYDYSEVYYTGAYGKVKIICSKHGMFYKSASKHLSGQGCQLCSKESYSKKRALGKEVFIDKALSVHGDRYDYSKVKYKRNDLKVEIVCPDHGSFKQKPNAHLCGNGCPECFTEDRIYSTDDFLKLAGPVHGDRYDYSEVDYVDYNTRVKIKCNIHGTFYQQPYVHIKQKCGCPECGKELTAAKNSSSTKNFITRSKVIHGDRYDYSNVNYVNGKTSVEIRCKKHGYFLQSPSVHMRGSGCSKCGDENSATIRRASNEYFIKRAKSIHGDVYDYSNVDIYNYQTKVKIGCAIHGVFEMIPSNHLHIKMKSGCPKCSTSGPSNGEIEISEFLRYHVQVIEGDRSILDGLEIDIFIPEYNIGIEYNGLYWHSDKYKDRNYHLYKTELASSKNVRLIHIFEDEWVNNPDIVKSRLLNLLGKSKRLYARQTMVREISTKEYRLFLNNNHIQGTVGSKVKLGLYHNYKLVSVMGFGALRKNLGHTSKQNSWELLRFCNLVGMTVVGGASKLYKYFIKKYQPSYIISYCDRRWGTGNLYLQLGMSLVKTTVPNYFYVKSGLIRESRFKYRKDVLVKNGHPSDKSERQIMEDLGYVRLYDCGSFRFDHNINEDTNE